MLEASQIKEIDKLIENIAKDDMDSFAQLYKIISRQIYAYALSIVKSTHHAEDILQEVFLTIKKSAHTYTSSNKPMAWILTITKRIALMNIRKENRELAMDYSENESILGSKEDEADDVILLKIALENLTQEEREIVFLKAISGLKHKEIASLTGRPVGTIMWIYNSSIKKLTKLMEG